MIFFKKNPESVVKKQFSIWHDACMVFIQDEDKALLDEPRPKLGACLFFIGSIDYLCQTYGIEDTAFAKLSRSLLINLNYPSWLISSIVIKFYVKDKKLKFALDANLEGGKRIAEFLTGKNKMSPYVFSSLVREWAKKPDLTADEVLLFDTHI